MIALLDPDISGVWVRTRDTELLEANQTENNHPTSWSEARPLSETLEYLETTARTVIPGETYASLAVMLRAAAAQLGAPETSAASIVIASHVMNGDVAVRIVETELSASRVVR